jgi:hypothetical protein
MTVNVNDEADEVVKVFFLEKAVNETCKATKVHCGSPLPTVRSNSAASHRNRHYFSGHRGFSA